MAAVNLSDAEVSSKDMTRNDLHEFSNIFASEFNNSDLHDRVLCFQIMEDEAKAADDECESSETGRVSSDSEIKIKTDEQGDSGNQGTKDGKNEGTVADDMENNNTGLSFEPKGVAMEPHNVIVEEQKQQLQVDRGRETMEYENKEIESTEDTEDKKGETANTDDENKSAASKLFVHSQWLAVQSPYFRALFFSGLKETYSKEVVMKIYKHELQAHLTLIEAMYKLDVLNDKDYRVILKVFVLAHKYDIYHVIKKCKYILMSITPSLEICEHSLQEIAHLPDTADIYDMLEKFLVKEFSPIDKTWTMTKFTELSKAALRLLLGSDSLPTQSENTIFVALMKWVRSNISSEARNKCDLLNVARFDFMSVDFLYDVVQHHIVASKMPGFNKYLLRGLAYHGFSSIRREQLEPKPKKRPAFQGDGPTFSWVIDDELQKTLSRCTGVSYFSDEFWCQGYQMKLEMSYAKDSSKCGFYLRILNLKDEAFLNASYRAKSSLFVSGLVKVAKHIFTATNSGWGYKSLERNKIQTEKGYIIDVWVQIG